MDVADLPRLDLQAFTCEWPAPLGELAPARLLDELLAPGGALPFSADDRVRTAVRDLLRAGGYKPAGRGKPASEYLAQAAARGEFPRVNVAVDACNVVSLASGLPISLVDLDLALPPLRIDVAPAGTTYVFNASGQVIDVSGLLCLFDAQGATASPVKDAQRTKTGPTTRRTLSLVWGPRALGDRAAAVASWYRELSVALGARVAVVQV